jgi:hypothetical protein
MSTGETIITTSERRDHKRCEWRWWLHYRAGLRPTSMNIKLWFGIGVHEYLAVLYGKGTRRYPKRAMDTWHKFCDTDELSRVVKTTDEEWVEARVLGAGMLRAYIEHWDLDRDWDVIHTEHPFTLRIPYRAGAKTFVFASTFDGVYRHRSTRKIRLMEHKTAKAISTLHLEGDEQASGYHAAATWILQNEGILGKGERIDGITYNFLRKALDNDDRPTNQHGHKLNKDGTVSKNQGTPFFVRETVDRRAREVVQHFNQLQLDVERMDESRARGFESLTKYHNSDCHWDCDFYNMCLLHDQGTPDWTDLRDSLYTVQDPYRLDYRKGTER